MGKVNLPGTGGNKENYVSNPKFADAKLTTATVALGIVLALAWNDAIKLAIKIYFGSSESLAAFFTYAIVMTIAASIILRILSRHGKD
jgi:uncharacterized membrane protein (DUF4010 family)